MHSLLSNQNRPDLIRLLEASTVAYTRAKSWEIIITYVLVLLAFAYPVTYIFLKNEDVKLTLFACSFLLTVLIQISMDTFKGNTSKGAIYKEEFDINLFQLPWKSTLKHPDPGEVEKLSEAYKGREIRDWYSPNLSAGLPRVVAIAVLQHLNTSWDIVLRKTYRKVLIYFLLLYTLVLAVALIVKSVDPLTIFLLLFSVLSFYTHFFSLIRAHTGVIRKREAISGHLDEILKTRQDITPTELRDIQDEIFHTRQESTKVPNFFFRWYQGKMNQEAEAYIKEVNSIYSNSYHEKEKNNPEQDNNNSKN